MVDYRTEPNIGARIKAVRRDRGYRTTRDRANAMTGSKITAPILDNIESGRKSDLAISQLLNIAAALSVPPSYLLAPLGRPDSSLDLPNLSDALTDMTALEFDSWLGAVPSSSYRATNSAERIDLDNLTALHELATLKREAERLDIIRTVQTESGDRDLENTVTDTNRRAERVAAEIASIQKHLASAGWNALD
jgi:transcriptional regulator with XRE-family HTH domain